VNLAALCSPTHYGECRRAAAVASCEAQDMECVWQTTEIQSVINPDPEMTCFDMKLHWRIRVDNKQTNKDYTELNKLPTI